MLYASSHVPSHLKLVITTAPINSVSCEASGTQINTTADCHIMESFIQKMFPLLPRTCTSKGIEAISMCDYVCGHVSQFVGQFVSLVKNAKISTFTGLKNCCMQQ